MTSEFHLCAADGPAGSRRDAVRPAVLAATLLLTPALFVGPAENPFAPVKTLAAFCAGSWLLFLNVRRGLGAGAAPKPRGSAVLLAPLLLWAAASAVWAANRHDALWDFLKFFFGAVFYFNAASEARAPGRGLGLHLALTLSAGLVSLYGVGQFFGLDFFRWDIETLRVSSSFGNPAYLAGFLVLALPIAAVHALIERRAWLAALKGLCAFLTFVCLILTQTRIGWFCAAGQVCFLAALFFAVPALRREAFKNKFLAAGLAAAVLLTAGVFSIRNPINPNGISIGRRTMTALRGDDRSRKQRELIWRTAWGMFQAHPVLGVGLGNYRNQHALHQEFAVKNAELRPFVSFPYEPHNDLLQIACEMGAPAALLAVLFSGLLFKEGWRASVREENGAIALTAAGTLAGLAGLAAYSFFQFPLRVEGVLFPAWIVAGWLHGAGRGNAGGKGGEFMPLPLRSNAAKKTALALTGAIGAAVCLQAAASCYANWRYPNALNATPKDARATLRRMSLYAALDPYDFYMNYRIGRFLLHHQEGEKAVEYLTKANRLFQNNTEIQAELGSAFLNTGDLENALHWLKKAAALDPWNQKAFTEIGIAYHKSGLYNEAASAFSRALEIGPKEAQNAYNLGLALKNAGRFEEAASAFQAASGLRKPFPDALYELGAVYLATNRPERAESALREALTVDPGHPYAKEALGAAYAEMGDGAKAAPLLIDTIKKGKSFQRACYYLERLGMEGGLPALDCEANRPCRTVPANDVRAAIEAFGCPPKTGK